MRSFDPKILKSIYTPPKNAHKPQGGSVLLIGGSELFHAASLWSLTVISRIVDMTFYSSVERNNELIQKAKSEFRDGIVVPRGKIDHYIGEADCILIGPGLPRKEGEEEGDQDTKELTEGLLRKYPDKKWVIDGGSLQVLDPKFIPENAVLTPHQKEFGMLIENIKDQKSNIKDTYKKSKIEVLQDFVKEYKCVVLLKGEVDYVATSDDCVKIEGGNSGMTKGGTGDVLAGVVAALYAKNDAFLSASAASYINKKAGESLYEKVSYYFNASDLASEIPKVMNRELLK